jgi:DNA-binding response OmpR family regulator
MSAQRILVVGRPQDCAALAELMGLAGYQAERASAQAARRKALQFRPDIVVADVICPTIDGLDLLHSLEGLWPGLRTVMVSSRPSRALEALGVTCLTKPLELPLLWETLSALSHASVHASA